MKNEKKAFAPNIILIILVIVLIILTIINMTTNKQAAQNEMKKYKEAVISTDKENENLKKSITESSNNTIIEEPLNLFLDLYYGTTPDISEEVRIEKLKNILTYTGQQKYINTTSDFDKKYHPQLNDNRNVIKIINRKIYTRKEDEKEIHVVVIGTHQRYIQSIETPIEFPFLFEATMLKTDERGWVMNEIIQGSIYTNKIGSDPSADYEGE